MQNGVIPLSATVIASAAVVGKKEHEGPLGQCFDEYDTAGDSRFGMPTWESAESEMQRRALTHALAKARVRESDVDLLFAGDLLNQCVGSAYGLCGFSVPYFGLYGACSTSAEGLLLGSIAISGGLVERCAAVTSSHYCAAERQYRTPLEYGAQRAPTAQWTVTGAGAFLLGSGGESDPLAHIVSGCPGRVIDMGVDDPSNMGAAMAPAAADTLIRYFHATQTYPDDFDLILTGDLGFEGVDMLRDILRADGITLGENYTDCGKLIYDKAAQDVHSGGSGCGCSASVMASHILSGIREGKWRRVLFLATGAMMSPDSVKQGKSIPAIAHLLELRAPQDYTNTI